MRTMWRVVGVGIFAGASLGGRDAAGSQSGGAQADADIVVVSRSKGSDTGEGTKEAPHATLSWALVIVGGASVTGVALVTGTILAVVAHGKAADADTKLGGLKNVTGTNVCVTNAATCAAIDSDRAARDRLANASMGVFIGAGAVGVATLGYALLSPKARPASGRVQVLPAIGARDAGVMLVGVW